MFIVACSCPWLIPDRTSDGGIPSLRGHALVCRVSSWQFFHIVNPGVLPRECTFSGAFLLSVSVGILCWTAPSTPTLGYTRQKDIQRTLRHANPQIQDVANLSFSLFFQSYFSSYPDFAVVFRNNIGGNTTMLSSREPSSLVWRTMIVTFPWHPFLLK